MEIRVLGPLEIRLELLATLDLERDVLTLK